MNRKTGVYLALGLVALLLHPRFASSQSVPTTHPETVEQLVRQVKELQARVAALEAQSQKAADSTSATTAPTAVITDASDTAPPSSLPHDFHGIEWRGFGEIDYKVLDQRAPELATYGFVSGSHGNFYTGNFDLFLTSEITDKWSVLSEIVIGEQDAQRYSVDLDRVLLKYDYDDSLKLSFGRYQTGIGYYNTAFHSGSWFQTTADRPFIMEFSDEGGPLPTQAVGISVTGVIPSGKFGLNYLAEYGSSDTVRPDLGGLGVKDENNGNTLTSGYSPGPGLSQDCRLEVRSTTTASAI